MKFYYLVNNEKVYIEEGGQLFSYCGKRTLPADASEHPYKLDMTKNRVDLFFDAEELNDYVLERGLDDSLIIPCHRFPEKDEPVVWVTKVVDGHLMSFPIPASEALSTARRKNLQAQKEKESQGKKN